MDNNELSDENDVVFRDVILLALTGFISMVILLIPFVNPPTEEESSSTPPGNVIVELFWDNKRDVDIDLWVQAPDDIPVGYSNKGGLFFNLLRDDLGIYKDNSPTTFNNLSAGTPGLRRATISNARVSKASPARIARASPKTL